MFHNNIINIFKHISTFISSSSDRQVYFIRYTEKKVKRLQSISKKAYSSSFVNLLKHYSILLLFIEIIVNFSSLYIISEVIQAIILNSIVSIIKYKDQILDYTRVR